MRDVLTSNTFEAMFSVLTVKRMEFSSDWKTSASFSRYQKKLNLNELLLNEAQFPDDDSISTGRLADLDGIASDYSVIE